jgi:hypothetical protein
LAVFLSFLTVPVMNIDLNTHIWAIDHVAAALFLSVDTAREHTYSHDFPKAKASFASNLWLREDVLAWFAARPTADQTVKGRAHKRRAAKPVTA